VVAWRAGEFAGDVFAEGDVEEILVVFSGEVSRMGLSLIRSLGMSAKVRTAVVSGASSWLLLLLLLLLLLEREKLYGSRWLEGEATTVVLDPRLGVELLLVPGSSHPTTMDISPAEEGITVSALLARVLVLLLLLLLLSWVELLNSLAVALPLPAAAVAPGVIELVRTPFQHPGRFPSKFSLVLHFLLFFFFLSFL
jgi:hypothetical protein